MAVCAAACVAGWLCDSYLEGGLEWRDDDDGKGRCLRLTCRPAVEASVYRTSTAENFNALPDIAAPTLVLAGETTNTRMMPPHLGGTPAESFKYMAAEIPRHSFEVVPGSHFFPMVRMLCGVAGVA